MTDVQITETTIEGPCTVCGLQTSRERKFVVIGEVRRETWGVASQPLRCPPCSERHDQQLEAAARRQEAKWAADELAYKVRRAINHSGVPQAYQPAHVAGLDHEPRLVDAARRFANGETAGLLLTGPVGTGKTTIAAAAAMDFMRREGSSLKWFSAAAIMNRLSGGFNDPRRAEMLAALDDTRGALVLDDLDKTRPTSYGAEPLFVAIDSCISNRRPLIATTNLSPSKIAAHWPEEIGAPMLSRLMGYCEAHTVSGEDRRLHGRPRPADPRA